MALRERILPNYTYDDYVHWEGRWEIIDGIPFAMSPLPLHQRITAKIGYVITDGIKKSGCKHCHTYCPIDYKIGENNVIQPDVLVVCGKIEKPYLDFPPALVVEVLSPSTALKDRHTKFDIYQSEKVKYYLIADPVREFVEV